MSKSVLQWSNVSFSYTKGDSIIADLSFSIQSGEFICLLGPSGSGKTTIFRLITGLEQPSSGSIIVDELTGSKRLGKVGYMPQQDLLLPWRTIIENTALPLEVKGVNKTEAHKQAMHFLNEVGLGSYAKSYPHHLSGGMRQRVSFIRAMLGGTNLLLLDEPFSALDAITRLSMQEWLVEQWQRWQKTILFITHDVDEALFLADRILLFSHRPLTSFQDIDVPLSRPRTITDLHQRELVELKMSLLDQLRAQVKR